MDVKEVSSYIKSWLELSIDTLSPRKGPFNQPQPKRLGSITLRSKEREETPTVLSKEPYGAYVILRGFPLRYRMLINNNLMWRSHRSLGFLVSQEPFWNCGDAAGRCTKLEDARSYLFWVCKQVYS